jgi:diguanylate cyclase (GGDEF)-like protein
MQKVAVLYDASQAVLSATDLDHVLHQILIIARDFFHLQNVAVLMLDEEKQELQVRCQIGWTDSLSYIRLPLGSGITGVAAQQKRPIYVPNVSADPRYIPSGFNTKSEFAVPLIVEGAVVGVLDCQSAKPNYFSPGTIDLLTLFSTQASIAIQNARLNALGQRRARELKAINAIAQQSTAVLDVKELLSRVCPLIQENFQLPQISVLLKEEDDLVLSVHQGMFTACVPEGSRLPLEGGLWGVALASGKTQVENEIKKEKDTFLFFKETTSRMCIPLFSSGHPLGVLLVSSDKSAAFKHYDTQPLESAADICATAIQNARYVERVKQLAYLDGLTGIFNRRYFELRITEEIERARRFRSGMAVMMVDIDQFKNLNDEFGHLLGDEVLRQVSSIFHQQLRKIDVVCRFGGEEFAILLSQTNAQHAESVAEKLRRLVETWQFPGVPRPVTISAGVSTFPEHGGTRDELVKAADAGLYAAKQGGRNRVVLTPFSRAAKSAQ